MSCTSSVSAANGFIDLATFSELESFLYGGPLAISWFVGGVQKANWFTIVPIQLRNNCAFGFGLENVSSSLNRSGDYVLNTWFRCEIPSIGYTATGAATTTTRWTRNLMHNLIKKCSITFNELTVEEFDNYWLDFNMMFRIQENKRVAYNNMIGEIASLTTDILANNASDTYSTSGFRGLRGGYFSVVLPFFFGEDSGIALPVAALPFNDVKVNYEFRRLEDLLVMYDVNGVSNNISLLTAGFCKHNADNTVTCSTVNPIDFRNGYTYAHYAVVHNDERVKMGDAPRDMLIRQVQAVCVSDVQSTSTQHVFDVRLSHAIISFFFAFRNKTNPGEWSNYTTGREYGTAQAVGPRAPPQANPVAAGERFYAPITHTQLVYESSLRLDSDIDFYSLIHPYLFSEAAPIETGYNMWTYALRPWDPLSPSGSTNYSKLANVQVRHDISTHAQYAMTTGYGDEDPLIRSKFSNVFEAINWNIARVANGSLGHPTL